MEKGTAMTFDEIRNKKAEMVANGECYTPYYMWLDGYERGLDEGIREGLTMRVSHPPKDEYVFPNEYVEQVEKEKPTVLSVAEKCKLLRFRWRLSQMEFGKKFLCTGAAVSKLEAGYTRKGTLAQKIEEAYKEEFGK